VRLPRRYWVLLNYFLRPLEAAPRNFLGVFERGLRLSGSDLLNFLQNCLLAGAQFSKFRQ
jgi:hypothetical protein